MLVHFLPILALAAAASDAMVTSSKAKVTSAGVDAAGRQQEVEPACPIVISGGERVFPPVAEAVRAGGREMWLRPLHDELQLTYVHGLFDPDELHRLVALADARRGWVRSPLKKQQSGEELSGELRNSSSCPLLWPPLYESSERRAALAAHERGAEMLEELELASRLASRVAAFFEATGMPLSARHIEPLQLVRYAPTERFVAHHDYHEIDPRTGALGGSTVQGEQRTFTVLLLGATLPHEAGGETNFPELDLSIWPRLGTALSERVIVSTSCPHSTGCASTTGRRGASGLEASCEAGGGAEARFRARFWRLARRRASASTTGIRWTHVEM